MLPKVEDKTVQIAVWNMYISYSGLYNRFIHLNNIFGIEGGDKYAYITVYSFINCIGVQYSKNRVEAHMGNYKVCFFSNCISNSNNSNSSCRFYLYSFGNFNISGNY